MAVRARDPRASVTRADLLLNRAPVPILPAHVLPPRVKKTDVRTERSPLTTRAELGRRRREPPSEHPGFLPRLTGTRRRLHRRRSLPTRWRAPSWILPAGRRPRRHSTRIPTTAGHGPTVRPARTAPAQLLLRHRRSQRQRPRPAGRRLPRRAHAGLLQLKSAQVRRVPVWFRTVSGQILSAVPRPRAVPLRRLTPVPEQGRCQLQRGSNQSTGDARPERPAVHRLRG
jgi:hypothetical protein